MSTYAWILLSAVSLPVLLSFENRVRFVRHWPRALLSALLVGIPFAVWDALAAFRGDWAFEAVHTWEPRLFGLPWEELLFFLLVPFACLFVWRSLKACLPERLFHAPPWLWPAGAAMALSGAVFAWPRFYTATLLGFTGLFMVLLAGPWRRAAEQSHFWLTQILCVFPFLIVNGFLTALPVVTYSPAAILGLRLGTIPVEDFLYSFVLVGANLLVFQSLESRGSKTRQLARREG